MTHQTLFIITSAVAAEVLFTGAAATAYHNVLMIGLGLAALISFVRDA